MASEFDTRVRLAAFSFLEEQCQLHGDVLSRALLEKGFALDGEQVHLINPRGIFIPRMLEIPLTFNTTPPNMRKARPYDDELGVDGVICYRYQGSDPQNRDNVGMRRAMAAGKPLIYLFGVVPGQYLPVWPVYIVGDSPSNLTFDVKVDERVNLNHEGRLVVEPASEAKRTYITVVTQQRLHQQSFRKRVLRAYRERCAICQLRHSELLEAAHILSDKHPQGDPIIPNGLALCKLHHAAFDQNILGISPDYSIEIRQDILEEHDGPMLKHGIQDMQGTVIHAPKQSDFRPNRDFLAIRYDEFRKAG